MAKKEQEKDLVERKKIMRSAWEALSLRFLKDAPARRLSALKRAS